MIAFPLRPLAADDTSVTLRREDFDAITAALEDAADRADHAAVMDRLASGEEEAVPFELVERILEGEPPLRVWRDHRGLSAAALAERAGVDPALVAAIEAGGTGAGFADMTRLARALGVALDDLAPPG